MTLKSMIIYHIYPDDQTCYSWREKLVLSGDLHVFAWENQNILKKGPESCLLSLSIMRCKGYVGDDNTAAFAAVCFERMIQREQELWMHPTIIVDNNWYNRYCEYRWTARKTPPAWAFDELTWMQIRTQIQTFFCSVFSAVRGNFRAEGVWWSLLRFLPSLQRRCSCTAMSHPVVCHKPSNLRWFIQLIVNTHPFLGWFMALSLP